MKVEGLPLANRRVRAVLAALMAGLLASCTTAGGPGLEMASPSYNGIGVAAVMADVAESEGDAAVSEDGAAAVNPEKDDAALASASPEAGGATEGEALPAQVALLPAVNPAAVAATDEADNVAPASAVANAPAAAADPEPAAQAAVEPAEPASDETAADAGAETSTQVAVTTEPKKRSFLASLFSPAPAMAQPSAKTAFAPREPAAAPLIKQAAQEKAAPLIDLSASERPVQRASFGGEALPGVRQTSLFEIKHKSGIDDDSDVDLYEDAEGPVVLASAAGLARLAPNGLLRQRESVDVACLKPALVRVLKTVERHYGKRMVVTSGYRSPSYNRRVRGARRSQHMYCAAADVQVPGISKWKLAKFVRSMPGRGGVGTYCHTESVHIDVGPERDWNWRCRRRKS